MRPGDEQLGVFSEFPKDLLIWIFSYCMDAATIFNLVRTSRSFLTLMTGNSFLKEKYFCDLTLLDAPARNDEELLKQLNTINPIRRLLSHAALGEWQAAEALFPLASCPGTIFHPNCTYQLGKPPAAISPYHNPGRYKYIKRSAFQIALMNEECGEVERIRKNMSEDEAARQFFEVFPEGEIKKYDWDINHAKALLAIVYVALINDETIDHKKLEVMNDATKEALHTFYDYIRPVPVHEIGLVFDTNIYIEALRLYDEQDDQIRGKFQNESQRRFWNIRVEGYIATLLGTGYLRAYAQGIGNRNTHRRGCMLAETSSIFPFRRSVASNVAGRDFFVGYFGYEADAEGDGKTRTDQYARFSNLVASKMKRGEELGI